MTLEERIKANLGNMMWQIITMSHKLDEVVGENIKLKTRLKALETKDLVEKSDD